MTLDRDLAARIARIALGHVDARISAQARPCPASATRMRCSPRDLHPIFFGSFDWHSCVHGWWTLLTLRRLFPDMAEAARDRRTGRRRASRRTRWRASSPISTGRRRRGSSGLMAGRWLLSLHLEATRHDDQPWAAALEPLARAFADAVPRLSRQADLSDPRRHAFQHRLRADPGAATGPTRSIRALAAAIGACGRREVWRRTATARRGSRAATNSCRPR